MSERRKYKLRPMAGFSPAVQLMGIGWYVALTILLGVFGGVLLDGQFDTKPVLTLVGLTLGLILAFWGGYTQLNETLRTISSRRREKP